MVWSAMYIGIAVFLVALVVGSIVYLLKKNKTPAPVPPKPEPPKPLPPKPEPPKVVNKISGYVKLNEPSKYGTMLTIINNKVTTAPGNAPIMSILTITQYSDGTRSFDIDGKYINADFTVSNAPDYFTITPRFGEFVYIANKENKVLSYMNNTLAFVSPDKCSKVESENLCAWAINKM